MVPHQHGDFPFFENWDMSSIPALHSYADETLIFQIFSLCFGAEDPSALLRFAMRTWEVPSSYPERFTSS